MIPLICDPWAAFGSDTATTTTNAAPTDAFDFGSAFDEKAPQKIKTEKKAPARPPPARPPPARPAPVPVKDDLL